MTHANSISSAVEEPDWLSDDAIDADAPSQINKMFFNKIKLLAKNPNKVHLNNDESETDEYEN